MSAQVICKYHPDAVLIEDYHAGDQICSECGLVVGDRVIDVGSEWRTFSSESGGEDKSRVGGPENALLGGSDLYTMIGTSSGPAGVDMSGNQLYNNRRTVSSSGRALINASKTISNGKNLKGRSHDAIAAACMYIACRQEGVPRTFKEIVAVSSVSKKDIGKCFKLILKAHDTSVDIITTGDFMSRFCGTLSMAGNVQKAATFIAKKAMDLDMVPGRSPISVAAASIYMASQASSDKRTGREIADIAGVSDVTIRQSYKLMLPRASELFPTDFKFITPIENLPHN